MLFMEKNFLIELIDKIEAHETEGVGNKCTRRVVIHYQFAGHIESSYKRKFWRLVRFPLLLPNGNWTNIHLFSGGFAINVML